MREISDKLLEKAREHPLATKISTIAAVGALSLGVAGCDNTRTYSEACDHREQEAPMPREAQVNSGLGDEREEDIFACDYFNDMRIPYNEPTNLVAMDIEHASTNELGDGRDVNSDIFIINSMDSSAESSSSFEENLVSTFRFIDSDGLVRTAQVPTERIKFDMCEDESCTPSVTMKISEARLFNKRGPDDRSIWAHRAAPKVEGESNELPSTGQLIDMLSSEIIVEIPKESELTFDR